MTAEDPFSPSTESVAERAEEIAESLLLPDEEAVPRRDYVCCVFSIGGRDYHLPIKQMKEITDLPQLLPLPLAPPMVSGLINLRGEVIPVINLAILNQHQQSEVRVQRRLVVAEHKNESLAFLVDGVPYLAEDFSGEKIDMSKFLSRYQIRGVE
jgi:purine-binding chemotaxis protein CheW